MARKRYFSLSLEQRMDMVNKLDMPQHDKNNLMFLMKCSPDEMVQFLQTASQDDIDYAQELFRIANNLIAKKLYQLDLEEEALNSDVDMSDVKDYLKKFMLKGDKNGKSRNPK